MATAVVCHASRCLIVGNFSASQSLCKSRRRTIQFRRRALRCCCSERGVKWKDYEDAVQQKDLARALTFLELLVPPPSNGNQNEFSVALYTDDDQDDKMVKSDMSMASATSPSQSQSLEGVCRQLLDACLDSQDMSLVGRTYEFLQAKGFLPNFGRYRAFVSEGPITVTPDVLKNTTGLEASKFAPKKWGLSGTSVPIFFISMAGISFLVDMGIDLRPKLAIILGLTLLDSVFLGGSALAQVLCLWPPYRRRVLVHEAGHVLAAYLLGCPVRGVVLDPLQAAQVGIQGQAGTQFWDKMLASELLEEKLSSESFDRYCLVLFAGIAAEALIYGEAEGGESDENLFRGIASLLRPPWSISQMSNQARWAVQQSYQLLKENKEALTAAFRALEKTSNLGFVIAKIEDALSVKHC